ncbi:MAG: helix-turn-helix domain-containing protein [Muribaculaceae bacterium]|nr:helix-turn-helix domain-containing protein [Muribaculaceae bacterium]
MEKVIKLENVAKLKSFSELYSQIDDSYVFSYIRPGQAGLDGLIGAEPMRLGGTLMLLMRAGSPVEIEINQVRYVMKENSLLVGFPGNIIQAKSPLPNDLELYALFCDLRFSQSINVNMTSVPLPSLIDRPRNVTELSKRECERISAFFSLLYENAIDYEGTDRQICKLTASSILSGLFYHMVQIYHRRISDGMNVAPPDGTPSGNRRTEYVRDFIKLVHLHHTRERAVAFYAEKLFISPKYLSLLIKESTGRSAAKWIDEFVLMEAKNMLRFSGKNIQQIAYALNFPTQSSFGKYFKHMTGMSPSEYQKS